MSRYFSSDTDQKDEPQDDQLKQVNASLPKGQIGDVELTDNELGRVTGGNTPTPAGPVPLPYPTVVKN